MEIVRFGDLYLIPASNGVSRPSEVRGQGYKMVNMGELFANDIICDIPMERVELSDKEKTKFLLHEDDLLFARQSLIASGAGKCSIVKELGEETTFESHLIRIRLNKKLCNPWYFFYQFQLKYNPIKTIVNQCAQAGIRGAELKKIKIYLPPRKKQDKISSILSSYDDLIENNNKRIKILEQMAENLYKEWFVYEKIKDKSKEVRLNEIINIIRGLSYTSEEIEVAEGVNLVNLKNIQAYGGFRRDGLKLYAGKYKNGQVVSYGNLIMGVTDMTQDRRTVGSVAIVPRLEGVSVISADLIKISSKINNVFLYAMFKYGNVSKYISQFANGANVLHLKPQAILNVKILLPPKSLIDKYVNITSKLFNEIEYLNQTNDNLTKQRDMLLPRLMSGKLEV